MTSIRANAYILAFLGLLALVLLTYANHFRNDFHFDDSHAVVDNVYIRDLHNIPLFFRDGRTSTSLPANRTYRPVATMSLAIDYWLGRGLHPLWFHISTFFWFLMQLGLMIPFFRVTFDRARPGPNHFWIALFATAWYGVHPAIAETVNYIIQRSDLYATLGVVAGFAVFVKFPKLRTTGLYLAPVVLGILSKAPAAVFPALLLLWIWLFEEERFGIALKRSIAAWLVAGAAAVFVAWMNPPTYVTGASSALAYRMTQPVVLMSYFRRFFLPLDLSADTDRIPITNFLTVDGVAGTLFVLTLIAIFFWCRTRREWRPVGFGIAWFLIASLPTSLIALAEVENDHRLFLPFVGLAMSVTWAGALLVEHRRIRNAIVVPACALLLAGFAYGARERNKVWATEETLWRDVTIKSPNNGRGLMNYGLTLMAKGQPGEALDYFNRALYFNPAWYVLEINLGIANTLLGRDSEGERHFLRAILLSPNDAGAHYYYARWLAGANRKPDAIAQLEWSLRSNPDYMAARYLLMETYASTGDAGNLRRRAQETLTRFPTDSTSAFWLARADKLLPPGLPSALPAQPPTVNQMTADTWLEKSLALYRAGQYRESIQAAQAALKLRPDYAEAWNNIGAAYNQLGKWDDGIVAEQEALRYKPDFEIARNNLMWAFSEKQKTAGR